MKYLQLLTNGQLVSGLVREVLGPILIVLHQVNMKIISIPLIMVQNTIEVILWV